MKRNTIIELIIHIVFWIVAFYFFTNNSYLRFQSSNLSEEYYSFVIVIISIYFNNLLLIPRFFNNQKYLTYFGLLLLSILTITIIEFLWLKDDILQYASNTDLIIQKTILSWNFSYIMFRDALFVSFFTMIKIYQNAVNALKLTEEKSKLEKQNYENRIEMVKSRINSHFLYNCMNVICALANRKSDKTLEVTQNLVRLMEYVVSDTENKLVALDKEIGFLKNYIALECIRHRAVNIDFKITGDPTLHKVPPMIFESFVNNALKYTNINTNGYIKISMECMQTEIKFICENTIGENRDEETIRTGKGLLNTTNRLGLHYKNMHSLSVTSENNIFRVQLILKYKY
jgi:hypothetical protein